MNSRIAIFIGVIFMLLSLLVARLIDFQLVQAEKWQAMATANREFGSQKPRLRAAILDRYKHPLVINDWLYYRLDDPTLLFGSSELVSPDEGKLLLATDSARVLTMGRRWYPLGAVLAPVLGYVGSVTVEDLKREDELTPVDQVGKQGLEAAYDIQLRGSRGQDTFEVSAMGAKQRLLRTQFSSGGSQLSTTIDPFLSAVAYQALGQSTGAVVITDVKTGEILSLVSKPTFDPNILTEKLAESESDAARRGAIQAMFADPNQLFFNRAVAGVYPPGSIFKLVTALAGLETNAITPQTEVLDEGILRVGDFSYANWYFSQYGRTEGLISLQKAIARSNDIYFYKAAEAAGPEAIANMAREIGFGQPLGLALTGEAAGLVPDPEWKESVKGERWFLGNTYHFGIGQGDLLVTPVQIAQLAQTLLNAGTKCRLHLTPGETRDCQNLGINEADLQLVLAGMEDACSTGGTAFPFFAWNEQVRQEGEAFREQLANGTVACKTGTAEFGSSSSSGIKKTHGWFLMGMGVKKLLDTQLHQLEETSAEPVATPSDVVADLYPSSPDLIDSDAIATQSSQVNLEHFLDKKAWLSQIKKVGFPDTIAIVVLVESDDTQPYREGSRDAGPIAKAIIDWMVH